MIQRDGSISLQVQAGEIHVVIVKTPKNTEELGMPQKPSNPQQNKLRGTRTCMQVSTIVALHGQSHVLCSLLCLQHQYQYKMKVKPGQRLLSRFGVAYTSIFKTSLYSTVWLLRSQFLSTCLWVVRGPESDQRRQIKK